MADENPEKKVRKRQPVKKAETKKTAKKAEPRIESTAESQAEGREEAAPLVPDAAIPEMQPPPVKRPRARRPSGEAPAQRRTAPRKAAAPVPDLHEQQADRHAVRDTTLGADGRLGSAPVCQDRGPGGSVGVADRRARTARPLRHARPATLPASVHRRRRAAADAAGPGRSAPARLLLRTPSVGSRHARPRATSRSSSIVRGFTVPRPATFRTTRCASPSSAAPRSSTRGCAPSGPRLSTRTTGRPASCPCIRRCTSRTIRSSVACRPSSRSTTWRFRASSRPSTLPAIGLGVEVLDVQGLEFWGNVSYLKGGINFSERITTVSPGYASEIVLPELGFGFEGVLARRSADLVGILNGIDTARWTPTNDEFVPASFSADDLRGKRDRQARGPLRGGAAGRRRGARAAARWPHLAPDRSEGVRPHRGGVARAHGARRDVGDARQRRAPLRRGVADVRSQPARPRVHDHRVRRAPRAPHRGWRRHVSHAVALRAVWPEPDVQPALRHRADRARHRRA